MTAAAVTLHEAYPKYFDDPIFLGFLADFYIKREMFDFVIIILQKMEQSKGKSPITLTLNADINFYSGRHEEAERLYKEALGIDDTYYRACTGYANCLNLRNDPNCRKYYEKAIELTLHASR